MPTTRRPLPKMQMSHSHNVPLEADDVLFLNELSNDGSDAVLFLDDAPSHPKPGLLRAHTRAMSLSDDRSQLPDLPSPTAGASAASEDLGMEKYDSELLHEIVEELNAARQNPSKYATDCLVPLLDLFVDANTMKYHFGLVKTEEGKFAIEECINFLKAQKPVGRLKQSQLLYKAVKDHVKDHGAYDKDNGELGHYGTNGSTFSSRIEKHSECEIATGENVGSINASGPETARYIVCGLLIDDDVKCPNHPTDPMEGFMCRRTPDCRGHRHNIFNPKFGEVGVAVCDHPWSQSNFARVFAMDFAGKVNKLGHRKEMRRIRAAKEADKMRHKKRLRHEIMYDEKEFTLILMKSNCSRCDGNGYVYIPELEAGADIKCPRCKGTGSFPGDSDKSSLRTEQHHESTPQLGERLELPKNMLHQAVKDLLNRFRQANPGKKAKS